MTGALSCGHVGQLKVGETRVLFDVFSGMISQSTIYDGNFG